MTATEKVDARKRDDVEFETVKTIEIKTSTRGVRRVAIVNIHNKTQGTVLTGFTLGDGYTKTSGEVQIKKAVFVSMEKTPEVLRAIADCVGHDIFKRVAGNLDQAPVYTG